MKKNEIQNRFSAVSAQAREQNLSTLEEARMLFENMSEEAGRQVRIEQEDARHRSPLVKALLALALISCFFAIGTGIYGVYNFPDAPLRQKGEVYTGKRGQPRTREDFERFTLWQKALFISFGSTFLLAFSFAALDAREKRRWLSK
jgi:hypothetical protein